MIWAERRLIEDAFFPLFRGVKKGEKCVALLRCGDMQHNVLLQLTMPDKIEGIMNPAKVSHYLVLPWVVWNAVVGGGSITL